MTKQTYEYLLGLIAYDRRAKSEEEVQALNAPDPDKAVSDLFAKEDAAQAELDSIYAAQVVKVVKMPPMHYGLISKELCKTLDGKFSRSCRMILRIMSDGKRHTKTELKTRSGVNDAMRRLREVRAKLKPYGLLVLHSQVGQVHADRLVKLKPKKADLPKNVQREDDQTAGWVAVIRDKPPQD